MTAQVVLFLVLGFVFLAVGADTMVRGAARLAERLGIPSLIVGLTVVAFGTSMPEALVTVNGVLAGETGIAVGNVVGSNIFNVLVILGLSAAVAPLVVSRELVRLHVPLMIGASLLVLAFALDHSIGRGEGLLLLAGIGVYTTLLVRRVRRSGASISGHGVNPAPAEASGGEAPETGRGEAAGDSAPALEGSTWRDLLRVAVGLGLLVLGSRWLVSAAGTLARALGVSDLVIGLTIVAAGTSLPELSASVAAALRGERDIAAGNIIGSNLFNLLFVLGTGAVFASGGLPIASQTLAFDLPVMIAVAVACLPIFFTGYTLSRWEGIVFLGYYLVYATFLVVPAMGGEVSPLLRESLMFFVIPLTLVTLLVVVVRERRAGR